jgi:hypothetical protein
MQITSISKPRNTLTMNFRAHSPGLEDGGARLETFPSTASSSGKIAETSGQLPTIAQGTSNPKILGKSTLSSDGTS